ncbi:hypothetical protein PV402_39460 [Streptomyces scabiei]|uniref:hypothetical protein n=1 Tax=Streptomyces scabiei TaxID=1930 RepID=UPI0029AF35B3|nr:hypothetical protein [Streptomyces scabiei]MDX2658266.1 hypothetical protein [Streptomyces scabiei]MDX2870551.1 hypothetical protein [Streptomyces scabiei]
MSALEDPEYVSFADAAALIVRRGLAGSMTPRGLRYMALARNSKSTPDDQRWPFGDGPGQKPYLTAGRTRMMHTARLLEYLKEHPPTGRGPDKGQRARCKAGE